MEIQWLSTWGEDANRELADILDLPRLTMAGDPPPTNPWSMTAGPGTRGWWKADVVLDILARDPHRRVMWVDDELAPEGRQRDRAELRRHLARQGRIQLLSPHPPCALRPYLAAVERWLAQATDNHGAQG